MNRGAGCDRGAREAARIAQRLQIAAPPIQHGADVSIGSRRLSQSVPVEHRDRHAAPDALFRGLLDGGRIPSVIGGAQGSVLPRLAGDLMTADKVEREDRRIIGKCDHAPAEIGAERRFDRIGVQLQSRIELTAVVAGGAPDRLLCFEHDRIGPLLGEMQCGRKSGKPAAHDRDRHVAVGLKRRGRNRRDGSVGIKAWWQCKPIVGRHHRSIRQISLHKGCSTRRRKSCVRTCCG